MINILPYNQKKVIERIRYMRIATVTLWVGIILFVVAIALFLPTLQTINSRFLITNEQMVRLEQSGAITKAVDVIELQRRTRVLKDILAANLPVSPMQYIDRIRTHATAGIILNGYDMSTAEKPVVEVRGVASTRQGLQQFVSALQSDATVASVDSPVSNFVKSSQSDFIITVTFKSL